MLPEYPGRWGTGRKISRRHFVQTAIAVTGGVAIVSLAWFSAACSPPQFNKALPGEGANEIWIVKGIYYPDKVTVQLQNTVTWTNKDTKTYTVTSDTGVFEKTLAPGESFSYTFIEHNNYHYHTANNFNMKGLVFVEQRMDADCTVCHG